MINNNATVRTSAPGRICLFGEHQDYLALPVIPCAISLRIRVEGVARKDNLVRVDLPDIGSEEFFTIAPRINYTKKRDYLRSAVNVLQRKGAVFSHGFDCRIQGSIPINSGTSSSSALTVAWIRFLLEMTDSYPYPGERMVANFAHEAEVLEFREPGGMMDHYATSVGGVSYIDFDPVISLTPLPDHLSSFVLGDSLQPKATTSILSRVKNRVVGVVEKLGKHYSDFSLRFLVPGELKRFERVLNDEEMALLRGTVVNHHITRQARLLMQEEVLDHQRIGELLTRHQTILRDVLGISTTKIDTMLEAAIAAGAYGGKINGSGGGGCMFAYAPENPETVAEAVEKAGGNAYIVRPSKGTELEQSG